MARRRWDWAKLKQKLQRRLLLMGLLKPEQLGSGWWRILKAKDVEWGKDIDEACRKFGSFYIKLSSVGIFYYFCSYERMWKSVLTQLSQKSSVVEISGEMSLAQIQDKELLPKGKTLYIEPKRQSLMGRGFRCTWKDLIFSGKRGRC